MARSTKAEVERRVAEIFPLLCDCMTLREIRAYVAAKTDWGRDVSDSQLKRYMAQAHKKMAEAAVFSREQEFGAARRRIERIIARAAAKGDLRTMLTANRQLGELLGLPLPSRLELSGHDGGPMALTTEMIAAQFNALIDAKAARVTNTGDNDE